MPTEARTCASRRRRAAIRLDAVAERGRITILDGGIAVATSGEEQRASGAVRGGGPTITIRSARGDIVVKPNEK